MVNNPGLHTRLSVEYFTTGFTIKRIRMFRPDIRGSNGTQAPTLPRHDAVSPMARKDDFSPESFLKDMAAGGAAAERAARRLLQAYKPRLRARYFHKGVAFGDMEELEAEVFSAVMHGWPKLEAPAAFRAWFNTIADNILNQHWSQKMRDRQHLARPGELAASEAGQDDDAPTLMDQILPDLASSDPEVRRCFHNQLEAYETRYPARSSCIALVVAGHDDHEIAEILGRSYGAARQYISQCCALLASFLSVCLGPDDLQGRRRGKARPEA